ncbi:MAG: SMC-Scp complex subunit ScpB [Proteobacteria bacterium]|nr:SMC-Scp complex subunit ScpB [Pseudomonadota bacterium]
METTLPLKQIIEGAILAAEQPLSVDQLLGLFEEDTMERSAVKAALSEIAEDCADRGYELKEVASGYRFQVKTEYGEWISRLWKEKPPRYTRALLETLALIAYKQPITRGDVEDIRGVAVSTNIIRTLLEREWVRIVGHRDVPGHPALYATTKTFLDYFNLKSLDELPALAEIRDLTSGNEDLNLEEELIEMKTLEIDTEEQEAVAGLDDADLDAVTNQVNSIQENIRNLFVEEPAQDDLDDLDDDDDPVTTSTASMIADQADESYPDDLPVPDNTGTAADETDMTAETVADQAESIVGSEAEAEADADIDVEAMAAELDPADSDSPESDVPADGEPASEEDRRDS